MKFHACKLNYFCFHWIYQYSASQFPLPHVPNSLFVYAHNFWLTALSDRFSWSEDFTIFLYLKYFGCMKFYLKTYFPMLSSSYVSWNEKTMQKRIGSPMKCLVFKFLVITNLDASAWKLSSIFWWMRQSQIIASNPQLLQSAKFEKTWRR